MSSFIDSLIEKLLNALRDTLNLFKSIGYFLLFFKQRITITVSALIEK